MENEIRQLATSIRKRCERLSPLSPNCCIYRIPEPLRFANKAHYKPCLISIGPFHYGKKSLQPMEELKLRYLENFLRRNEERSMKDYLGVVRQREKETRECYAESIELTSEEFMQMVLLDAIFVIEFFLLWYIDSPDETDRIFTRPSLEYVIKRDLLLLENQLPYFILDGLYNIAFSDDTSLPCFIDLACEVLVGQKEVSEKFNGRDVLHLVDFLRMYHLPPCLRDIEDVNGDENWDFPPGVGDLHDAGVKLRAVRNEPLLNIRFENGVLGIPTLDMEDHTKCWLLNLSAFEQCHYHFDSYIVDYVVFMDILITTQKDVEILMKSGIVPNYMGSNEDVADVFNTICSGTSYQVKRYYYSRLCRQLCSYSKKPWNRWRATLKHDYFSNPWTIISVIVAIFLLILTVIQTACTIVSM